MHVFFLRPILATVTLIAACSASAAANKKASSEGVLELDLYLCVDGQGRRELVDKPKLGCHRIDTTVAPSTLPIKPGVTATADQIHKAKRAVVERRRDPESARFRRFVASANGKYVCGQLNAKNRLGGCEGYQAFSVYLPTGVVDSRPNSEPYILRKCS